MSNVDWITEKQLEQGRVQAEKIYKEFLEDTYPSGEQTWDEIEIDGQYFDIECWDDDMENPRTKTTCAIYAVYPTDNGWRECDGTKFIRLFTNGEKS
jgi:hypothetical protein|tara:strand:+ start:254 stop:544 length:291 start_codon:yes stop_codon:yes gene_type:complete